MASKASQVAGALRRLKQYTQGKTPQPGMFSTLDEIVADAPFEQNTAKGWREHLQPGKMFKREGMQFPLKKEELEHSGLAERLSSGIFEDADSITKIEMLEQLRGSRPTFRLETGREVYDDIGQHTIKIDEDAVFPRAWDETFKHSEVDPTTGAPLDMDRINVMNPRFGDEYSGSGRYHHTSPNSTYEESFTKLQGLVAPTHHTQDTLSWSRVSIHKSPYEVYGIDPRSIRLVEEIQADVHRKAAQKVFRDPHSGELFTSREAAEAKTSWDPEDIEEVGRVGYRTDMTGLEIAGLKEKAASLDAKLKKLDPLTAAGNPSRKYQTMTDDFNKAISDIERLEMKMHNAPHKNPKDYAQLELRKQLMNAADEGDSHLALVRGRDQIERYKDIEVLSPKKQESMKRMYDKIYAGELRRLAKRYGATVEDIELQVRSVRDVRTETMRDLEIDHPDEFFDDVILEMKASKDPGIVATDIDHLADMVDEVKMELHKELGDEMLDVEPFDNMLNQLDQIKADAKRLIGDSSRPQVRGRRSEYLNLVVAKTRAVKNEFAARFKEYQEVIGLMDDPGRLTTKSFPAIKITPEVRERILKVGVPQFQHGGLVQARDEQEYIPTDRSLLEMSDEQFERYENLSDMLGKERREVVEQLEETKEIEESWKDVPARIAAMMKSQWMTLDPETGEAVWRFPGAPIPYEAVAYGDMSMEDWNAMNEQIMSQNYPGIVDELLTIPGLPGMVTDKIPIPEFAAQAEERTIALRQKLREEAGLGEPKGLIDYGAEMTGIMAGQLPVPGPKGAKIKKAPAATGFHAAGRMAKAISTFPFKAGIEFFNPTIVPRLSTYGMGTAFGVAVGMGMSKDEEDLKDLSLVQEHRNNLIHGENEEILQEMWPEWSMSEKVAQMDSEAGPLLWAYLTLEQQVEMMDEFEDRGMLVEE